MYLNAYYRPFDDSINHDRKTFRKFKGKVDEVKRKIMTHLDEFDDQGDRELLELRAHYTAKLQKLNLKVSKVQKESDVFKAKAKS